MLDLKRNYSVSNVDFTTETVALNQLDVDNCLFTPELLAALLKCLVKCSKSQSQVIKNKEGIYLIVFRVLNNEKISLIYNNIIIIIYVIFPHLSIFHVNRLLNYNESFLYNILVFINLIFFLYKIRILRRDY